MRGHYGGASPRQAGSRSPWRCSGPAQTKPPEDDGSRYTWPGASILRCDVKPGARATRSEQYFVDCAVGSVSGR